MAIMELNRISIALILIIACFSLVLTHPADSQSQFDEEQMQADDYDYGNDDASSATHQSKLPSDAIANAFSSLTVNGILGEDITLKCDAKFNKSNVILWYKGDKIISTGNSVVLPNFSLDPKTYQLTILKSSPHSAGDYYCEILPQKLYLHTKIVLGEHSLDAIAPESSTSAQSCLRYNNLTMWLLMPALLLLHQLMKS